LTKKSILKKVLLTVAASIVVIVAAVWIFYNYYFQDYVNDFLKPKLSAAIIAATDGHYRLDIGKIVYKDGLLFCTQFELRRIRYGKDETGITLESLSQDTVFFKGWHLYDLLWGNGSYMKRLEMHAPKIVVIDIADGRNKLGYAKPDTIPIPTKLPIRLPVIEFDSIILTDMVIEVPKKFQPQGPDTLYHHASARLAGFRLDSVSFHTEPLIYSKHVDLELPSISFHTEDSAYSVEAGPIHAHFTDSVIRIDSFSFRPNFSEDQFSTLQPYLRGRIDYRCLDITVGGFDLEKLMEGESITVHTCEIGAWSFDYYSDKRIPREPHPQPSVLPNEFISEFPMPVNIDTLTLAGGTIKIRERVPGSKQSGSLSFDDVRIRAYPYCTDSLCENSGKPTKVSISALFLGEAPVNVRASYDLLHKELDLTADATVGKFSAKLLNTFLIPNERKEVTDGTVEGGKLHMDIRSGTAILTVTPYYKNLAMKILPQDPGAPRGIMEGLKTFVANTFVLHSENLDKNGTPAESATITLRREPHQEFLQFIWITLRKSLGKIIGGFD
jgi:hypothetical protein